MSSENSYRGPQGVHELDNPVTVQDSVNSQQEMDSDNKTDRDPAVYAKAKQMGTTDLDIAELRNVSENLSTRDMTVEDLMKNNRGMSRDEAEMRLAGLRQVNKDKVKVSRDTTVNNIDIPKSEQEERSLTGRDIVNNFINRGKKNIDSQTGIFTGGDQDLKEMQRMNEASRQYQKPFNPTDNFINKNFVRELNTDQDIQSATGTEDNQNQSVDADNPVEKSEKVIINVENEDVNNSTTDNQKTKREEYSLPRPEDMLPGYLAEQQKSNADRYVDRTIDTMFSNIKKEGEISLGPVLDFKDAKISYDRYTNEVVLKDGPNIKQRINLGASEYSGKEGIKISGSADKQKFMNTVIDMINNGNPDNLEDKLFTKQEEENSQQTQEDAQDIQNEPDKNEDEYELDEKIGAMRPLNLESTKNKTDEVQVESNNVDSQDVLDSSYLQGRVDIAAADAAYAEEDTDAYVNKYLELRKQQNEALQKKYRNTSDVTSVQKGDENITDQGTVASESTNTSESRMLTEDDVINILKNSSVNKPIRLSNGTLVFEGTNGAYHWSVDNDEKTSSKVVYNLDDEKGKQFIRDLQNQLSNSEPIRDIKLLDEEENKDDVLSSETAVVPIGEVKTIPESVGMPVEKVVYNDDGSIEAVYSESSEDSKKVFEEELPIIEADFEDIAA